MNKKRFVTIILALIMAFGMSTSPIYASDLDNTHIVKREIIYYPDGSSLETVVYQSDLSTYDSNSTRGIKTATYRNGTTIDLWSVTVTGTFTYTGRSSLCTSSSVSATSYTSDWKIIDKSSSYSRNQATGNGTASFYVGSTLITTTTLTVILTCDVDGNLS